MTGFKYITMLLNVIESRNEINNLDCLLIRQCNYHIQRDVRSVRNGTDGAKPCPGEGNKAIRKYGK